MVASPGVKATLVLCLAPFIGENKWLKVTLLSGCCAPAARGIGGRASRLSTNCLFRSGGDCCRLLLVRQIIAAEKQTIVLSGAVKSPRAKHAQEDFEQHDEHNSYVLSMDDVQMGKSLSMLS